MEKYKIIRHYFRSNMSNRVIETGLTLAEAQAHCQDPETSSRTCTSARRRKMTERVGPWFDGYERQ